MMNTRTLCVLGALSLLLPATLAAQIGAEIAVMGGQASSTALRNGVGGQLVLLIPNTPLTVGGRFLRHWGDEPTFRSGTNFIVGENDASAWFGELGLRTEAAGIELGATFNAGTVKITQTKRSGTGTDPTTFWTEEAEANEFTFAPGISATLPLGPVRVGGEIHYFIGGDPGFRAPFGNRYFIFYFRLSLRFGGGG